MNSVHTPIPFLHGQFLFFHLRAGIPSGVLPSVFIPELCMHNPPTRATCPDHTIPKCPKFDLLLIYHESNFDLLLSFENPLAISMLSLCPVIW
jgi:hypothetical protein